ncbi:MAG TPA: oligopeptide/dipeptide ABC transporter ATP-binding protein [Trueperaceae bacterium]
MNQGQADVVMRVSSVQKQFRRRGVRGSVLRAVDDVSIALRRGELYGLLGESGSGKSTLAEIMAGLQWPTSGSIHVGDVALEPGMPRKQWRELRRQVQVVFQNPFESVNPRFKVSEIVEEPLAVAGVGGPERRRRVTWALERVGLPSASDFASRFPHELSGGQLQRVCIARALTVDPAILIADEPVSMLDLSVRAGVLRLLDDLKRTQNMAILMISHDISTLSAVADRLGVMYFGKIVEAGPAEVLMSSPSHPYLKALLAAVPTLGDTLLGGADRLTLSAATLERPARGCSLAPRCPLAEDRCKVEEQELRSLRSHSDHAVRCWKVRGDS